jgi:hypothetical protein
MDYLMQIGLEKMDYLGLVVASHGNYISADTYMSTVAGIASSIVIIASFPGLPLQPCQYEKLSETYHVTYITG